jgi:hypothetical protein
MQVSCKHEKGIGKDTASAQSPGNIGSDNRTSVASGNQSSLLSGHQVDARRE